MSLLAQFGSYKFPLGQVGIVPRITTELNSRGLPITKLVVIDLEGDLFGDGASANATQRYNLEAAMQNKNQDFSIYNDRGQLLIRYRAADAMNGMTMRGMEWPNPNAGQFVTMSTFKMAIEGQFKWTGVNVGDTIEYTESIQQTGTAQSRFAWMYPVNARPFSYVSHQYTTCKFVQSGTAVGWGSYPRMQPQPFTTNPKYWKRDESTIVRGHPQGNGLMKYPISWTYLFEFDYEPKGITPRFWPK